MLFGVKDLYGNYKFKRVYRSKQEAVGAMKKYKQKRKRQRESNGYESGDTYGSDCEDDLPRYSLGISKMIVNE